MRAMLQCVPPGAAGDEALRDAAGSAANQGNAGRLSQLLTCLRARVADDDAAGWQAAQRTCVESVLVSTVFACVAAGGGRCQRCADPHAPPHAADVSYSGCVQVLLRHGVTPASPILAGFNLTRAERRSWVEACAQKAAHACEACGNVGAPLKLCARCRKVRYCDSACSAGHWRQHKPNCKKCEE
jgi:hypothetical protein